MKRVALVLIAAFLSAVVVLPAAETPVPARNASHRSYKKGKKVKRGKAAHRKTRRRAAKRRSIVN